MGIHHHHKKHLRRHGLHDTISAHDEMYNMLQSFFGNASVHHGRMRQHRLRLDMVGASFGSRSPKFGMSTTVSPMFDDDNPTPERVFMNSPVKKKQRMNWEPTNEEKFVGRYM